MIVFYSISKASKQLADVYIPIKRLLEMLGSSVGNVVLKISQLPKMQLFFILPDVTQVFIIYSLSVNVQHKYTGSIEMISIFCQKHFWLYQTGSKPEPRGEIDLTHPFSNFLTFVIVCLFDSIECKMASILECFQRCLQFPVL